MPDAKPDDLRGRARHPPLRNALDMSETVSENADLAPISGNAKMKFDDVILGRRSIRGYKPDPVPQELIKEILALAMRAQASRNNHPWSFYCDTGAPLDGDRSART